MHLLPLAVDATLGLGPSLTLLGDDYPTPDGSCARDFIHVSDLLMRISVRCIGCSVNRPPVCTSNSTLEAAPAMAFGKL